MSVCPHLGGTPFPSHNIPLIPHSFQGVPQSLVPGAFLERVPQPCPHGGGVPQPGPDGEHPSHGSDRWVTPARSGWGYPSEVQMRGCPSQVQMGVPWPGMGTLHQVMWYSHPEMGYPLSRDRVSPIREWGIPQSRDGVPSRIGQQVEYLIHSRRCASCVHAGVLSRIFPFAENYKN